MKKGNSGLDVLIPGNDHVTLLALCEREERKALTPLENFTKLTVYGFSVLRLSSLLQTPIPVPSNIQVSQTAVSHFASRKCV